MTGRSPALALCALALAAVALPAGATHQTDTPPPITPITTMRYALGPTEIYRVPTRGGEVFVRIVRPMQFGVPLAGTPVILTYTPYASVALPDVRDTFFVRRGYARAVADVIGTGSSGGCWDYGGAAESASASDLVEWLGTRTWSNGKVGMIGASYDGTTANMAAVANAPHLATIVPQVAISDWYSYAYADGVRWFLMDPAQRQGLVIDEQGFDTPAGFDFAFGVVPTREGGVDTALAARLAERACPDVKAEHTLRAYSPEPDKDAFWIERDYLAQAANLAASGVPVLVQGGWRDYNVKHSESSRWFEAIPVDDPDTPADEGVPYKMLVMGQGAHGGVDPDIAFQRILHAWFDRFLFELPTNIDLQRQSISKANDGVRRDDWTWPPPGTATVPLYLRGGGALSTGLPDGDEGLDMLVDTGTMTESGALFARGTPSSEVLWFESPVLTQDLRVAGMPALHLFASTLGTSTHFAPALFDLGPPVTVDASLCTYVPPQEACTVSRGFLNARYRNGLEAGDDLTPGGDYQARVRFIDNDWVFKAGHRIAVAIMASNLWWGLPDQQRVVTTIYRDGARSSALVLPLVGGAAAAAAAGL